MVLPERSDGKGHRLGLALSLSDRTTTRTGRPWEHPSLDPANDPIPMKLKLKDYLRNRLTGLKQKLRLIQEKRQHVVADPSLDTERRIRYKFSHELLMTGWADMAALAGESHEIFMAAILAFHTGKAVAQIAAIPGNGISSALFQVADTPHGRDPLLVYPLQFLEKVLYASVIVR